MRSRGSHHPPSMSLDAIRRAAAAREASAAQKSTRVIAEKILNQPRYNSGTLHSTSSLVPAGRTQFAKPKLRKGESYRTVLFVYDPGQREVGNVMLHGSWNKRDGRYSASWGTETVAMRPAGNGKWAATVQLIDDGQKHDWEWGVIGDTPAGEKHWAVYGSNLKLDLTKSTATYTPATYHLMGARKTPTGDLTFKVWLPGATSATARITSPRGDVTRIPLTRDGDDWSAKVRGGFAAAVGSSYVYEVVDASGTQRLVADPYALESQGEQRGISNSYFDPVTGLEATEFSVPTEQFLRFESAEKSAKAYLVLQDANGQALTRDAIMTRLGDVDPDLRKKIAAGRGIDDLVSVDADGRIAMHSEGDSWTVLAHNPKALEGLRYVIQHECPDSIEQDAWNNRIGPRSGTSFRDGVIVDGISPVSRAGPPPTPWRKAVMYQIHVGSFLSSANNSHRSTFEDVIKRLDYLKDLGINAIEMLPIVEVAGVRDWGYLGVMNMAVEHGLGYVRDGKWVSGREALDMLRDATRARGMNLVCDVVYNHALADGNPLSDVSASNPYYNWGTPEKPEVRMTPWGPMPAFNNPRVRQFLIDHAVMQVLQHGFDGIRFDFTQPIYEMGGDDGRKFLIDLTAQVFDAVPRAEGSTEPSTAFIPEDFSYKEWIVNLMGHLWYTEFQHRLVHDHNPDRPGLIQAAALGKPTDTNAFLELFTSPFGIASLSKAITIISNHDEVGNAVRNSSWGLPLARFAMLVGQLSPGIPFFFQGDEFGATNQFLWGKPSTWDMGWSWLDLGNDWDWETLRFNDQIKASYQRMFALGSAVQADPAFVALAEADKKVYRDLAAMDDDARAQAFTDISRRQMFQSTKDFIALRKRAGIDANAVAVPLASKPDLGVLAYTLGENHVVVGCLKDQRGFDLTLPPGTWREVLNTDSIHYGGQNVGNGTATFQGRAHLLLPKQGALVLERVSD